MQEKLVLDGLMYVQQCQVMPYKTIPSALLFYEFFTLLVPRYSQNRGQARSWEFQREKNWTNWTPNELFSVQLLFLPIFVFILPSCTHKASTKHCIHVQASVFGFSKVTGVLAEFCSRGTQRTKAAPPGSKNMNCTVQMHFERRVDSQSDGKPVTI